MKHPCWLIQALIFSLVLAGQGLAQQTQPRPTLPEEDLAAWKEKGATERWITPQIWGDLAYGNTRENDSWHGFGFAKCLRLSHFDKKYHLKSLTDVSIPRIPFALSIQSPHEVLAELPRFREKLQVLLIREDPIQCNSDVGDWRFLGDLTELRMVSIGEPIGDQCLKSLAGLKSLESLHVQGRWITDVGLAELPNLKQLKTLSIMGAGQITPAGAKEIAKLKNLRSLRLASSAVSDEVLAALTELSDLESLHLGATPITDAGAASLIRFTSLHTLVLRSTRLTNASVEKLTELKDLRELDLSGVYLTQPAVEPLTRMGKLEKLHLRETIIKKEAIDRLKVKIIIWTPPNSSANVQPERDGALAARTIWNGRTLEEWFQDINSVQLRGYEAEKQLVAAAVKEPDVSRVVLRYVRPLGSATINRRLSRILAANPESAATSVYERLSDENAEEWVDPWCINYLREQKDTSPEAIAALVACLHSKKMSGDQDDGIPRLAAARLGEIGLPALDAVLNDRLRGARAPWWNHGALEMMGVQATDRVLEH